MYRPGGTRVSVIVVMTIVCGLIAILFPVVQRMRESQARLQTNNNLKECALAVHAFHDAFKRLPDAYGPATNTTVRTSRCGFNSCRS